MQSVIIQIQYKDVLNIYNHLPFERSAPVCRAEAKRIASITVNNGQRNILGTYTVLRDRSVYLLSLSVRIHGATNTRGRVYGV